MSDQESVALADVIDVDRLKALAYDQLLVIERAQSILQALNARIAQIQDGGTGG